MLYPFVYDESEDEVDESYYNPREYEIDFETGQLTGKIAEGIEALKVWAWLALQTAAERYYIYSWDYGQEYETMIGKGYTDAYMEAELKRMTEECLTVNPLITGIDNFVYERDSDHVTLSFLMLTEIGDKEMTAEVDNVV